MELIEVILSKENLNRAYKKVVAKKVREVLMDTGRRTGRLYKEEQRENRYIS